MVDDPDGRGIALRFSRYKRRRPDKSIEQATTTEEVAHLFYKQKKSYKCCLQSPDAMLRLRLLSG
jgi:hypothetical protein